MYDVCAAIYISILSPKIYLLYIASVRILNSVYSYRLYTYKYKAKQETTKTLSRLSCTDFFSLSPKRIKANKYRPVPNKYVN